ncbi:unnamed protein product, partial [Trichogramma brassicae]
MPMSQGCQNCLTIIDRYTRWPQAIPLADIAAPTVARALFAGWISLFGTPLTITTDQGGQFESKLLAELGSMVGAKHVHTTPYHPKGNGMVERMHRTLKAALRCSPQTPWTLALPAVLLGLRTTFKEDLQASPSEMLFGPSLRIPGEFIAKQDVAQTKPADFVVSLRQLFAAMRPVPASRHVQHRPFVFKELGSCEYVLRPLKIMTIRRKLYLKNPKENIPLKKSKVIPPYSRNTGNQFLLLSHCPHFKKQNSQNSRMFFYRKSMCSNHLTERNKKICEDVKKPAQNNLQYDQPVKLDINNAPTFNESVLVTPTSSNLVPFTAKTTLFFVRMYTAFKFKRQYVAFSVIYKKSVWPIVFSFCPRGTAVWHYFAGRGWAGAASSSRLHYVEKILQYPNERGVGLTQERSECNRNNLCHRKAGHRCKLMPHRVGRQKVQIKRSNAKRSKTQNSKKYSVKGISIPALTITCCAIDLRVDMLSEINSKKFTVSTSTDILSSIRNNVSNLLISPPVLLTRSRAGIRVFALASTRTITRHETIRPRTTRIRDISTCDNSTPRQVDIKKKIEFLWKAMKSEISLKLFIQKHQDIKDPAKFLQESYTQAGMRRVEAIHRRACLRVISGRWLYQRRHEDARAEERQETLRRWQSRWDRSPKRRWTHRLIPNIRLWIERRHGEKTHTHRHVYIYALINIRFENMHDKIASRSQAFTRAWLMVSNKSSASKFGSNNASHIPYSCSEQVPPTTKSFGKFKQPIKSMLQINGSNVSGSSPATIGSTNNKLRIKFLELDGSEPNLTRYYLNSFIDHSIIDSSRSISFSISIFLIIKLKEVVAKMKKTLDRSTRSEQKSNFYPPSG